MTNHDIGSQIVNGIMDAIKFDQIEIYIVAIFLIGLAWFIIRNLKQARDPPGRLIGDMEFYMKGQKFAGRVFEQEGVLELEDLDELEKDEDDNARKVANVYREHRYDLKLYAIKIMPMKGGTIQSGLAFLMTHNSLEDPYWSSGIGSHIDPWRGKIHLRQANPAFEEGRIDKDGIEIDKIFYDYLIYYPMVPLDEEYYKKGGKIKLIENPHATMELAAWLPEFAKIKKRDRSDKVARSQAEKYAEEMGTQATGTAGELNELSVLETMPRFDEQSRAGIKQPLHPMVATIFGVFGMVLTFGLLRSWNPQADPMGQVIVGGLFGVAAVFIVTALKK